MNVAATGTLSPTTGAVTSGNVVIDGTGRELGKSNADAKAELAEALQKRGLQVATDGRLLLIGLDGAPPYDLIRDTVVELGAGLLRLEQRRNRLEDLFRVEETVAGP